jgi:Protein of unknown function (DUF2778)
MSWSYQQSTGKLCQNGYLNCVGYSGHAEGKNNPIEESARATGPIPVGIWKIVGPPVDTPEHGPYVLHLTPDPDTETFGRSGFLMHGDSIIHPGLASMGCIIMPRYTRQSVWLSGDRVLTVIQ